MEGGCTCGHVRYRVEGAPLIVHACHCTWCQRETGTAHALNALFEADHVVHTAGQPELVQTPSASGRGQIIARCPHCRVAVWSNYSQAGPAVRFTVGEPFVIEVGGGQGTPRVYLNQGSKRVLLGTALAILPTQYPLWEQWMRHHGLEVTR